MHGNSGARPRSVMLPSMRFIRQNLLRDVLLIAQPRLMLGLSSVGHEVGRGRVLFSS